MILRIVSFVSVMFLIFAILTLLTCGIVYSLDNWNKAEHFNFALLNGKEWFGCLLAALFIMWMVWVSTRKT